MIRDSGSKFSPLTLLFHWVVGLMMIGLLAVGWYMAEFEVGALYAWHKSFGTIIILVVLPRVIWRIMNGWPEPASQYTQIEIVLSKLVHYLLLIGTLLMPISGFIMSAAGGHGVDVFSITLVASNPDPANPGDVIAHSGALAGIAHTLHHWAGNILIIAVLLHIGGALKHHIIDKDGTLRRMLGSEI